MSSIWQRFKNEPAFVGATIIAVFNGLVAFQVLALTAEQVAWIDGTAVLVFGAGVRQLVYGPKTGAQMAADLEVAQGELLARP